MKVFFSQSFESKGQPFSGQNGLYASLTPVYGTRELWARLTETFKRFNVAPEPEDELHVTLMYSRESAPDVHHLMAMHDQQPVHSLHAVPKNLEYWAGHDGAGYVVLHLDGEEIHSRHSQYKNIGCTHSFDDFTPHMTVVKDLADGPELQAAISEINEHLKTCAYKIVLGAEAVSDIKP